MKNIIVLGAGPAAVVTAMMLQRMGHRVRVIGRVRRTAHLEGASPRVAEGLARAHCHQALALLGPRWQRGAAWAGEYREVNGEHVIDRQRLDRALLGDLTTAGVEFIDAGVQKVSWQGKDWQGIAEDDAGKRFGFQADFLVEARGRGAPKWGSDACSGPLGIALYRNFQGQAHGPLRTLTEAFEEGWAWATIDAQGRCSLQLVVDHLRLDGPVTALHERLCHQLRLIPQQLGSLLPLGPVVSRGIQPVLRGGLVSRSGLRVGDAAYTCDPLSGHGMYEAISGAFAAAPTINTLLTRPDLEELACRFYRERTQSLFYQRLSVAAEFYQGESRWVEQPFWRSRREQADNVPHDLSATAPAHLTYSPVVENGLIAERQVLVTPDHPRGVRFVAGVELTRLLKATEAAQGELSVTTLAQNLSVTPKQIVAALEWLRQAPNLMC